MGKEWRETDSRCERECGDKKNAEKNIKSFRVNIRFHVQGSLLLVIITG